VYVCVQTDGTDIWLTTDPDAVVGDGPDGINYLLDVPLELHVKYWKTVLNNTLTHTHTSLLTKRTMCR